MDLVPSSFRQVTLPCVTLPPTQMVAHLEAEVCPPGARVWPVQAEGWLAACIDCGAKGTVHIKSSKTDYIVLTEEAWNVLSNLVKDGISVTGDYLTEVLQSVIAFYEVSADLFTFLLLCL